MNPHAKIQTPNMALSKARTQLLVNHPFFGTLAMRLQVQPDDGSITKTIATDGRELRYYPDYIKTLNSDELVGLIAHEVLHLACKHHERRQGREAGRWQAACDHAINPTVIDAGLTLPKGYLDCEMFHKKSAEEIYALLPQSPGPGQPEQGDGQGGQGSSPGGAQPAQPEQDDDRSEQQSQGDSPADPSSMGEVLDRPKDSPASATGEAWEAAVSQAARMAEKAGKMPAQLKRLVNEILNPTLPWETLLRRFMTSVSRDDYDWMRPNRRVLSQGLYLPGAYSERMEHMVVAIDTSGSINQPLLDQFLSEVNGIRQEVDCQKITLLQCSNTLGETKVFEQGQPLGADHITGGGGTSFNPVFDWLRTEGRGVECLVYFTDLVVQRVPDNPRIPVMWAKSPVPDPRYEKYCQNPQYGQVVQIKGRAA